MGSTLLPPGQIDVRLEGVVVSINGEVRGSGEGVEADGQPGQRGGGSGQPAGGVRRKAARGRDRDYRRVLRACAGGAAGPR